MNNWSHFEEQYGPDIGQGAQCRVYADGDAAVKVLSEGHVLLDVLRECYALAFTESVGIPTSNLYGVYREAGHIVIRMRRVSGEDLMETMIGCVRAGDHESVLLHIGQLVDMQLRMHAAHAEQLSSIHAMLRAYAKERIRMGEPYRSRLTAYIETLPDGDAFCHNDYHPRNVLYDGKDYTIIDWDAAGKGDPAGDVAHSYVAMMLTDQSLADLYLENYLEKSDIDRVRVMRWLPVHAMLLYDVLEGNPIRERIKPFLAELL